jgi:hypothetical protein
MKVYKSTKSLVKNQVFQLPHKEQKLLNYIKQTKSNCLIRDGNFAKEIIWNGTSFKFTKHEDKEKGNAFRKGLFLFGLVRKDAKEYIKRKGCKVPKQYPVNVTNSKYDFREDKIIGFDVDHAYWRIAFNFGIIKYNTYFYGLNNDFKALRLACLSTMGKPKEYLEIKNGEQTTRPVIIEGNVEMENVYKIIRYTCYKYMQDMMKMLKDDFVSYNTDCIYFRDTKENRKMIAQYLKSKDLSHKMLVQKKKALPTKETLSTNKRTKQNDD